MRLPHAGTANEVQMRAFNALCGPVVALRKAEGGASPGPERREAEVVCALPGVATRLREGRRWPAGDTSSASR